MTEIPIPSGPTNRQIIDRAYQVLGLSDSMFGRTDDEYQAALLPLGSLMLEWPFDQIGYLFEGSSPIVEEESGIDRKYLDVAAYCLAEKMGPTIGKALSGEAQKQKNTLYSRLCASVNTLPESDYANGTPRGAGGKRRGVFFPAAC